MAIVRGTARKGLLLTPEVLRDAYGLVISTEPFCNWGLPDKHEVQFRVMKMRDTSGDHTYYRYTKKHRIRVSSRCVSSMFRLMQIMSHEAIHVAEVVLKTVSPTAMHNKAFMKMADEVCDCHGYDRHDFAEIEG